MNTVGRSSAAPNFCLISCAGLAAASQTGNRIPNYNSNPISNPTFPKQGRCHAYFLVFLLISAVEPAQSRVNLTHCA